MADRNSFSADGRRRPFAGDVRAYRAIESAKRWDGKIDAAPQSL